MVTRIVKLSNLSTQLRHSNKSSQRGAVFVRRGGLKISDYNTEELDIKREAPKYRITPTMKKVAGTIIIVLLFGTIIYQNYMLNKQVNKVINYLILLTKNSRKEVLLNIMVKNICIGIQIRAVKHS